MNADNITTIRTNDPDFQRVQNRRHRLMTERDAAVRKGDWAAMNVITKKLALLPTPVVRS
ncbi:hypothetical protein D3C83_322180 [compost metagenome]